MNISLEPGKYVVAVSGGVDSMVLLELLRKRPDLELIIAHYDHGIREESAEDRQLVQDITAKHCLPFVYKEGKLGGQASEAVAREARYSFLERVREAHHARAIITAHHQDDVLETAILNILRGTGRKGLTSLASRPGIRRPMLYLTKKDIRTYAKLHRLKWHEDKTNADPRYLRNYVRLNVLPRFSASDRAKLLKIIDYVRSVNEALDNDLINMMHIQPGIDKLDRAWFVSLPHKVAKEFLASWLRHRGVTQFDAKTLERVVVAAKVNRPGTLIDITGGVSLAVAKASLALSG